MFPFMLVRARDAQSATPAEAKKPRKRRATRVSRRILITNAHHDLTG
jgi:hypothetical protein